MVKGLVREKVDNRVERNMLIGAITSDRILKELAPIYEPDLVDTPYIRMAMGWCMDYFKIYGTAPGMHIQDIYNSNRRSGEMDESVAELTSGFLSELSKEYQRWDNLNADYLLDQVVQKFSARRMQIITEDVQTLISRGDVTKAQALIAGHRPVERPSGSGMNPFIRPDVIFNAFEKSTTPLMTFPGALGTMINPQLTRDAFISIMGPEKRGKTFWLNEFAFQAMKSRCNVAHFEVGDMSEDQVVLRLCSRLAGKSYKDKYCGDILLPILDCAHNQEDSCRDENRTSPCGLPPEAIERKAAEDSDPEELITLASAEYRACSWCARNRPNKFRGTHWYYIRTIDKPLSWMEAVKMSEIFMARMKGKQYKLSVHANGTMSVGRIMNTLDIWEKAENFVPDVIVIDYADLLAPEPEDSKKDFRHQQNGVWKALRRLSQERHCLVITATQADAASYEAPTLKMKHFSEDKRKYAHVTGMISLNQTEREKRLGIMRLGWLVLREDEFSAGHSVKVLQSLKTGRPCVASYF